MFAIKVYNGLSALAAPIQVSQVSVELQGLEQNSNLANHSNRMITTGAVGKLLSHILSLLFLFFLPKCSFFPFLHNGLSPPWSALSVLNIAAEMLFDALSRALTSRVLARSFSIALQATLLRT